MTRPLFMPMPQQLQNRPPHSDRRGPCNDPGCRMCDSLRAELRAYGEKRAERWLRRQARRQNAGLKV